MAGSRSTRRAPIQTRPSAQARSSSQASVHTRRASRRTRNAESQVDDENIHQLGRSQARSLQHETRDGYEEQPEEDMSASTSVGADSSTASVKQAEGGTVESLTQHALHALDTASGSAPRRAASPASSDLSELSSSVDQPQSADAQTVESVAGEALDEDARSIVSEASSTGSNTLRALAARDHTQDSAERQALLQHSLELLQRWKGAWHAFEKRVHRGQVKKETAARALQRQAVHKQLILEHQANERTMTTRQARD